MILTQTRHSCSQSETVLASKSAPNRLRLGRTPAPLRARANDVMIAAAYRANDLPIHTFNPDEFSIVAGLNVVAVPHPTTEDLSHNDGRIAVIASP